MQSSIKFTEAQVGKIMEQVYHSLNGLSESK